MIKRLVFDLDNTLIPWKNEYYMTFNKVLDKLHFQYDNVFISKLIEAVNNYENEYNIYNKNNMLEAMNRYTSSKLPDNFIDLWLIELSTCCNEADKDIIDTLEYLHQKYDLVVLTNWFTYSQVKRLEKAGIRKYFSHVYCTDEFLIKPYPESYLKATEGYKTTECIMIGDSIKIDIEGALAIGMNTIYYNYQNKENYGYTSINNFKELRNIL